MSTAYDIDLDRNPANFQPLTPLGFLERAAAVFPQHTAIIHGAMRRSYAEFYARARRLAAALARRGIKRGDTVSVMLANTPAMLECHYGVPMTGGVLNTLNTRLDAPIIAFTTLVSPWSSEKAMIGASSRVLSVLSTPPVIGTP